MNASPWLRPLRIHSPDEGHRQASWKELFVDLGFVVAVSGLSAVLHDFSWERLLNYFLLFFAIFWVWNRFTWYASYYDNGDVFFRIAYLLSVFAVVGLASTIEQLTEKHYREAILWYISLDALLLVLWGRVLVQAKKLKRNARSFFLSYALGLVLMAVSLWVPPPLKYFCWIGAFLSEIIGPMMGWRGTKGNLPVHTGHIVERHGLFTIILLGEGVVAISKNFEHVLSSQEGLWLLPAYLIIVTLWWIYFDYGKGFSTDLSQNMQRTFIFGYGQFVVFAALLLTTMSLEFGLEHYFSNQEEATQANHFSYLLLIGAGVFLVTLSSIQLIISTINPASIYVLRMGAGVALLLVGVFTPTWPFTTSVLVCLAILLVVGINDTYYWGLKIERERSQREPA